MIKKILSSLNIIIKAIVDLMNIWQDNKPKQESINK